MAIATFNGGKFLREQIQSILDQEVKPEEIIVCDDRSTDDTAEILESFQKLGLVKYFVNDQNLGVTANFKKAASLVNPQNYLALSDQDDVWLPNKLKSLIDELEKIDEGKEPTIVYSDMIVMDSEKNIINTSVWNELSSDTYHRCFETLLFGNFVHGCTVLMNQVMRRLFVETPDHALSHDYWLALIAYSFGRVSAVKKPLVLYRKHGNNVSYAPDHRRLTKLERRMNNLKKLFQRDDYMHQEIEMAKLFENVFGELLSKEQLIAVGKFKKLSGRLFIEKKWGLHKAFRKYWLT